MAARDTTITVGTSWTAVSDGAITTITLMQNQSPYAIDVIFAGSEPAADAAPDLIWPSMAVEIEFTVPNATKIVYARSSSAAAQVKIVHG